MISIVCCCDSSFILPALVMIKSLSIATRGERVKVFVITLRCDDLTRSFFDAGLDCDNLDVSVIACEESAFEGFPASGQYPDSVYLKLLSPLMVPNDIETLLYVDTDILFLHSPAELFDLKSNGVIRAVPELATPISFAGSIHGIKNHSSLGIPGDTRLFNSGVMLIDVTRWKALCVTERAIDYCSVHGKDILLYDQELLNILLWNWWEELGAEWNLTSNYYLSDAWADGLTSIERARIREKAKIIHYTKIPKPWSASCRHPDVGEWRRVCSYLPDGVVARVRNLYETPDPMFPGESDTFSSNW